MADTRPIFLAGPTAVGKSEVSLLLAEQLGGEIISVDSMQVYRSLDIGTAKPAPADRARVPHHLLDVVELNAPFDAAKFCALVHSTSLGCDVFHSVVVQAFRACEKNDVLPRRTQRSQRIL